MPRARTTRSTCAAPTPRCSVKISKAFARLREPSTWGGFAAAAAAIGPIFLSQPQVAAVVSIIGGLAVLLRERKDTKPD